MINSYVIFRKDIEVKFPVITGESGVPENYIKAEVTIRMLKWERTNIAEDMRREQELLDYAKANCKEQT